MISSGVLHGVGHFEWCDGIAYDVSLFYEVNFDEKV